MSMDRVTVAIIAVMVVAVMGLVFVVFDLASRRRDRR
jgi:hypothetical protein